MAMLNIAAALSLTLLAPQAKPADTVPSVKPLAVLVTKYEGWAAPAQRSALVAAVAAYCTDIERAFPQNSPAEDQWLTAEVDAGGERLMRAVRSAEWGRRQAKNFTTACATWTAVFNTPGNSARGLTGLAHTFVRFSEDSAFYARANNLDPERLGLPCMLRMTTESLLVAALATPA